MLIYSLVRNIKIKYIHIDMAIIVNHYGKMNKDVEEKIFDRLKSYRGKLLMNISCMMFTACVTRNFRCVFARSGSKTKARVSEAEKNTGRQIQICTFRITDERTTCACGRRIAFRAGNLRSVHASF